jgi:hypothetical protein
METQIRSPVEIYGQNHVQHGIQNSLYLTPNEVLFDTPGVLRCVPRVGTQKGETQDEFNRYQLFDRITNIQENQSMVWSIQVHQDCTLSAELKLSSNSQNTTHGLFGFNIQDQEYLCHSSSSRIPELPIKKGIYRIRFYLIEKDSEKDNQEKSIPDFEYFKLTCSRDNNLSVIRLRWRPKAMSTTFSSSEVTNCDAWVMGLKAPSIPEDMRAYCPMTTPFGYYGTQLPVTNQGPNFSLWSYGQKEPKPPIHQLSRILAIGDPQGIFDEFHHEGHGVKVRNVRNIWAGNTSKEYIFGLRIQEEKTQLDSGRIYSYYGYYWDESEATWRLYAMGQSFKPKKEIKTLKIGSFIEVLGGPTIERSGHVPREVSYFGYSRNQTNQAWYPIDTVTDSKSKMLLSDKKRKIQDGRFVCSMGGFHKSLKLQTKTLKLEEDDNKDDKETPLYLTKIHEMEAPLRFPLIRLIKKTKSGKKLRLKLTLPKRTSSRQLNKVTLYFGLQDGLSLVQEWDDLYEHPTQVLDGRHSITIPITEFDDFDSGDVVYFRIFTQNPDIQIWSKIACEFTF